MKVALFEEGQQKSPAKTQPQGGADLARIMPYQYIGSFPHNKPGCGQDTVSTLKVTLFIPYPAANTGQVKQQQQETKKAGKNMYFDITSLPVQANTKQTNNGIQSLTAAFRDQPPQASTGNIVTRWRGGNFYGRLKLVRFPGEGLAAVIDDTKMGHAGKPGKSSPLNAGSRQVNDENCTLGSVTHPPLP